MFYLISLYTFSDPVSIPVPCLQSEVLIPVYTSIAEAVKRHPKVSVMVNFSSFRSVFETTMDTLNYSDTIKTVAIIAEGVPESQTRHIIKVANEKKVCVI